MKRYLKCEILLGILLCASVTVGLTSFSYVKAEDEKPAAASVAIDNFSFTPKEISVEKGTTVTWTNRDDVPHTVVSADKKFKSKALDTDDKFTYTFTDAGTYVYFCSVHPIMTGKVIVK